MSVISLSIPNKLINDLEEIMEEEGYNNRSELIRDTIRNHVKQHKIEKREEKEIGGIISVMYGINDKKVSEQIQETQHQNENKVKGVLHLHYDEKNCFDIFLVKGKAKHLNKIVNQLKRITGTKHIGTDLIPIQ